LQGFVVRVDYTITIESTQGLDDLEAKYKHIKQVLSSLPKQVKKELGAKIKDMGDCAVSALEDWALDLLEDGSIRTACRWKLFLITAIGLIHS